MRQHKSSRGWQRDPTRGNSGSERVSGGYDLSKDEDGGGSDIDISSCYKPPPRKPLTISREKYNTESYDKMRDRDDILRDLYALHKDGGVQGNILIVQILLDIRDIVNTPPPIEDRKGLLRQCLRFVSPKLRY